jgi:hypothetical protein
MPMKWGVFDSLSTLAATDSGPRSGSHSNLLQKIYYAPVIVPPCFLLYWVKAITPARECGTRSEARPGDRPATEQKPVCVCRPPGQTPENRGGTNVRRPSPATRGRRLREETGRDSQPANQSNR